MKKIALMAHQIEEELEAAKDYAETYLDIKASGDSQLAQKYRNMADDELRHASTIHDRAVSEINRLKTAYTSPAEMEEKWNIMHKRYIEQMAWVKTMLCM